MTRLTQQTSCPKKGYSLPTPKYTNIQIDRTFFGCVKISFFYLKIRWNTCTQQVGFSLRSLYFTKIYFLQNKIPGFEYFSTVTSSTTCVHKCAEWMANKWSKLRPFLSTPWTDASFLCFLSSAHARSSLLDSRVA